MFTVTRLQGQQIIFECLAINLKPLEEAVSVEKFKSNVFERMSVSHLWKMTSFGCSFWILTMQLKTVETPLVNFLNPFIFIRKHHKHSPVNMDDIHLEQAQEQFVYVDRSCRKISRS